MIPYPSMLADRFFGKPKQLGPWPRAVAKPLKRQMSWPQGMLDFDFMCKREKPSVACMVFPFSGNHYIKFYWGTVSDAETSTHSCLVFDTG